MRIAASLSVKDEVELIEGSIKHLRDIGVDIIIACDLGSTDGTFEILERYRSNVNFWLFQISDREFDHFETWAQTHVALLRSSNADWAIFLDADEYWIPATGALRDCAYLATADLLMVDRFNIPVGPNGPMKPETLNSKRYEDLLLLVDRADNLPHHLEQNPLMPWVRWVPEHKVMARPERIGTLAHGAHDIVPCDSAPLTRCTAKDLIIAHLPFTTRSRFIRKMVNIREVLGVHHRLASQGLAWHWRRWVTLAEENRLDEELDRTFLDAESLADLQRQGTIRSAADIFRDREQFSIGQA